MVYPIRLFSASLLAALSFATVGHAATICPDELSFLAATGTVADPLFPIRAARVPGRQGSAT